MSKFTKTIAGFAGSIALIASLAGSAGAATFNTNLTVGSKGADVTALQEWLVSQGYLTMPAGVAMGYFGNLTKAAVAAYQTAKGISPAAGYFGPITRASVNNAGGSMAGGTSTVPGCSAGAMYSSTTGAPCATAGSSVPGCSAGAMYSSTTGQPCAGGAPVSTVADGKDGSLTVSYDPFAPSSQTLKKGDMNKPVIAVKLSAASGNVAVNRFDVEFDKRPWLYFSKITLKDTSGNIVATKNISSIADVDEITVGGDYKVRFDGVNYLVTPDADKTLVAYLDVLPASDKFPATVYVGIPDGNIRSINGKGYTDSLGISNGTGSDVTSTNGVTLTLSSTGSTGSITTRVAPSSPVKRTVAVSATNATSDVTLGVFSLKSQNQSSTINSLTFWIRSTSSVATTTLYNNVRLYNSSGALIAGANTLGAGQTFTNLNLNLPIDQWVDVKLVADVPSGNGGQAASITLVGYLIIGTDANSNDVTVTSAFNQASADNIYSYSGLNVSGTAPVLGSCIVVFGTNYGNTSCPMTFTLTLTAASNNTGDIFISKLPGIVLATSSSVMTSSTTLTTVTGVSAIAGDTSVSYRIPTEGRTFTYQGTFSKTGGAPAAQTFQINKIWFGTVGTTDGPTSTASSNASSFIDYGLESLITVQTL